MSLQLLMLHHFNFSLLGNAYAALLAYWLHSEVDEGAQEKRSLLSTHILILSSTHLYRSLLHRWGCSAGQGRRDWIEAVVPRCVPWRVHLRTQVVQWTLQRGDYLCQQRICVWLRSLLKAQWRWCWGCAGRIGTPPWVQSVVRCEKGFYGCTSQMACHGNKTSIMMFRVSQKHCPNRTKS